MLKSNLECLKVCACTVWKRKDDDTNHFQNIYLYQLAPYAEWVEKIYETSKATAQGQWWNIFKLSWKSLGGLKVF